MEIVAKGDVIYTLHLCSSIKNCGSSQILVARHQDLVLDLTSEQDLGEIFRRLILSDDILRISRQHLDFGGSHLRISHLVLTVFSAT